MALSKASQFALHSFKSDPGFQAVSHFRIVNPLLNSNTISVSCRFHLLRMAVMVSALLSDRCWFAPEGSSAPFIIVPPTVNWCGIE
jgi:hypothetical protein